MSLSMYQVTVPVFVRALGVLVALLKKAEEHAEQHGVVPDALIGARLADDLLARDGVRMVAITVHKPQAPIPVPFADVSVTVRRSRPSGAAESGVRR